MAATDYVSASSMDYLTALIKNVYSDKMIKAAKLMRYIINYLEKSQQVERMGQNKIVPIILAWAESVSPGTATSVLPAGLDPEGTTLTVTPKHIYGYLHVWHTEVVYADQDMKAFINAQQTKLEGLTNTLQAESEIYCYGDGGATPRCIATAASNASGVVTLTVDSTRLLRRGMPLDFKESNGTAITSGTYVRVKHVLSDTSFSVDVGSAAGAAFETAAADAYIYHASGKDQEPYGLEALIGKTSNTLFGINRATAGNEWYHPLVRKIDNTGALVAATGPSAAGTAVQPWDMKYLYQVIEILVSQKQAIQSKLAVFTSPTIRTKIVTDNRARGIAMPLSKKVDVWPEETVEIDGVPIIKTFLTRPGAIFIPALNTLTKYKVDDFNWDTVGGMWKQVYDATAVRGQDAKFADLRDGRRRRHPERNDLRLRRCVLILREAV